MLDRDFEDRLVRLRAVEPEDWESFRAIELDREIAYLAGTPRLPVSEAAEREWAKEASRRKPGDERDLVVESLAGDLVGALSVTRADRRHGVFGYALNIVREHWRNGFGREAVELLLRFYFRELRYQKVEVSVYAFNEASLAFHDALGFTREGRLRRSHWARGTYHDVVLFGMTVDELPAGLGPEPR